MKIPAAKTNILRKLILACLLICVQFALFSISSWATEEYVVNDNFEDGLPSGWEVDGEVANGKLQATTTDSTEKTLTRTFTPISAENTTIEFILKMDRLPGTDMTDFINITDDLPANSICKMAIVTADSGNSRLFKVDGGNSGTQTTTNKMQGGDTYFVKFVINYTSGSFVLTIKNLDQNTTESISLSNMGTSTVASKLIFNVKSGEALPCSVAIDDLKIYDGSTTTSVEPTLAARTNVAVGKAVHFSAGAGAGASETTLINDGNAYAEGGDRLVINNTDPEKWVRINLGSAMVIDAAQVYSGGHSSDADYNYKLQYNHTGVPTDEWFDIPGADVENYGFANFTNNLLLTFDKPITAQFIRYYSKGTNIVRLREIKLYASPYSVHDDFEDGTSAGWTATNAPPQVTFTNGKMNIEPRTANELMSKYFTHAPIASTNTIVEFVLKMDMIPATSTDNFFVITDNAMANSICQIGVTAAPNNARHLKVTGSDQTYTTTNKLQSGDTYFIKFAINYTANTFTFTIKNLDQNTTETATLSNKGNSTQGARLIVNVTNDVSFPATVRFDNIKVYDGNVLSPPEPTLPPSRLNAALGKTVTIFDGTNTSPGQAVTDGTAYSDEGTRLVINNSNANKWVSIDLGVPTKIDAAQVYSGGGSIYGDSNYRLEYSNDNDIWTPIEGTTVADVTHINFTGNLLLPFEAPITARYFRYYALGTKVIRLREMKLYRVEDGTPLFSASTQFADGNATADVHNYSGASKDVMLAVAYYNNGQLIDINLQQETLADTKAKRFTANVTPSGDRVEYFIWEGFGKLTPIEQIAVEPTVPPVGP